MGMKQEHFNTNHISKFVNIERTYQCSGINSGEFAHRGQPLQQTPTVPLSKVFVMP